MGRPIAKVSINSTRHMQNTEVKIIFTVFFVFSLYIAKIKYKARCQVNLFSAELTNCVYRIIMGTIKLLIRSNAEIY